MTEREALRLLAKVFETPTSAEDEAEEYADQVDEDVWWAELEEQIAVTGADWCHVNARSV